jgi:hypothetical protein
VVKFYQTTRWNNPEDSHLQSANHLYTNFTNFFLGHTWLWPRVPNTQCKMLKLHKMNERLCVWKRTEAKFRSKCTERSPQHDVTCSCWRPTVVKTDTARGNLLTPWSRVVSYKLAVVQLVNKFPVLYGIRKFITVFKSPPMVTVLSQMNPVNIITSYFLKIHFNIVLLSTPMHLGVPKRSLPFRFFGQNLISISHRFHACYMPCPVHPPRSIYNKIWRRVQIMKLTTKQLSVTPVTSFLLGWSQILSVCLFPLMLETKFHTYTKIKSKIIALYVLKFTLLDTSWKKTIHSWLNGSKHYPNVFWS